MGGELRDLSLRCLDEPVPVVLQLPGSGLVHLEPFPAHKHRALPVPPGPLNPDRLHVDQRHVGFHLELKASAGTAHCEQSPRGGGVGFEDSGAPDHVKKLLKPPDFNIVLRTSWGGLGGVAHWRCGVKAWSGGFSSYSS